MGALKHNSKNSYPSKPPTLNHFTCGKDIYFFAADFWSFLFSPSSKVGYSQCCRNCSHNIESELFSCRNFLRAIAHVIMRPQRVCLLQPVSQEVDSDTWWAEHVELSSWEHQLWLLQCFCCKRLIAPQYLHLQRSVMACCKANFWPVRSM